MVKVYTTQETALYEYRKGDEKKWSQVVKKSDYDLLQAKLDKAVEVFGSITHQGNCEFCHSKEKAVSAIAEIGKG